MKCENCNQDTMISVDDEGSLGGDWTHYVCAVCLSELDITINGNVKKITFTKQNNFFKRTKEELREYYHQSNN